MSRMHNNLAAIIATAAISLGSLTATALAQQPESTTAEAATIGCGANLDQALQADSKFPLPPGATVELRNLPPAITWENDRLTGTFTQVGSWNVEMLTTIEGVTTADTFTINVTPDGPGATGQCPFPALAENPTPEPQAEKNPLEPLGSSDFPALAGLGSLSFSSASLPSSDSIQQDAAVTPTATPAPTKTTEKLTASHRRPVATTAQTTIRAQEQPKGVTPVSPHKTPAPASKQQRGMLAATGINSVGLISFGLTTLIGLTYIAIANRPRKTSDR